MVLTLWAEEWCDSTELWKISNITISVWTRFHISHHNSWHNSWTDPALTKIYLYNIKTTFLNQSDREREGLVDLYLSEDVCHTRDRDRDRAEQTWLEDNEGMPTGDREGGGGGGRSRNHCYYLSMRKYKYFMSGKHQQLIFRLDWAPGTESWGTPGSSQSDYLYFQLILQVTKLTQLKYQK